jgi:hypothetical protein
MVRVEAQLTPEEAALVMKALGDTAESRPDALLAMAESTLRGDAPPKPPVEVVVHVSAESAPGKAWERGMRCS